MSSLNNLRSVFKHHKGILAGDSVDKIIIDEDQNVVAAAAEVIKQIKGKFKNNQQANKIIQKQINDTTLTVKKSDQTKQVLNQCYKIVFNN